MECFYTSDYIRHNSVSSTFKSDSWTVLNSVEQKIKEKIERIGKPLKDWAVQINYGIKTGFNEAFIIDTDIRNELIEKCPKAVEIIRPILRGRDLTRYSYHFSDLWMIITEFGSHKYLKLEYPSVYNYLLLYEERLKQRGQCRYTSSGKPKNEKEFPGQHHWLELDNNPSKDYLNFFNKPKIVWGEISDTSKFAYDELNYYTEATTFIMTGEKLKYLLSQLNSKLLEWYFNQIGTATGVGTNRWKKYTIELLPIKVPTESELKLIENLVNLRILSIDRLEQINIESEIDKIIYKLYELTDSEIAFFNSIT